MSKKYKNSEILKEYNQYKDILKKNDAIAINNIIEQYRDLLDNNYFDERERIWNKYDISEELDYKVGAVTFLDVLGWKGIYKDRQDAMYILGNLIKYTEDYSQEITKEINRYKKNNLKDINTKVISISDTIVLLSEGGDAYSTIKIHSDICSHILKISIQEYKLLLRGAISYGSYSYKNNILIGKAVDEAASWHESTDWIGVILSPTAQFLITDLNLNNVVDYENIPLKNNCKYIKKCVNWNLDENFNRNDFILKNGPLLPEIAGKYMNTFNFLDSINSCTALG